MRFFAAFALFLVVAQAGWVDLYKFPWTGVPLALMLDVACVSEGDCFVPGSTGSSAEAVWYTKNDWKTMTNATMHGDGLMLLAIAMGSRKDGVVGGIGALKLPGILRTNDGGMNWAGGLDILPVETQDVVSISGSDYGFVGDLDLLTGSEGVAITTDDGYIWNGHKWSKTLRSQLPFNCSIRYAAFPSTQTIYAACGSWPSSNNNEIPMHRNSKNLRIDFHTKTMEYDISSRWTLRHELDHQRKMTAKLVERQRPTVALAQGNGYTAGLVKSSDGGKNWEVQYKSSDTFYFNDVCCMSATNCIAVGEGFAQDGSSKPGARIWQTTDGKTWAQTKLIPGSSCLRCAATGASEAWAAVTYQAGGITKLKADFYHTTDGGKTWSLDSSAAGIDEIMGMDFVDAGLGYAVGITETKLTTPLKYTK